MNQFAILFDNDGVLIDSHEAHWAAWQRLMQQDRELSFTYSQFESGFGKRNDLILKEVAPAASEAKRVEWALRKEQLFREIAKGKIKLLPGIEDFLKEVKAAKIPRIIASSTPIENLKLYLSATVLGNYFDAFLSAEEVALGKPAPDVFIEAAKRIGFSSTDAIVIEDAPAGIRAGKAAGSFVIALATSHSKEELKGQDLLYASARELHLPAVREAYEAWKKE
jgi:beta-phosphoglucomutase